MPEPITTLTASAIATLAFQEFIKSGAGELAKKFTGGSHSQDGAIARANLESAEGETSGSGAGTGTGKGGGARGNRHGCNAIGADDEFCV